MNWFNVIERSLQTAWETFVATWPTGAVLTDWSAWKMTGVAALVAFLAAMLAAIKTAAQDGLYRRRLRKEKVLL